MPEYGAYESKTETPVFGSASAEMSELALKPPQTALTTGGWPNAGETSAEQPLPAKSQPTFSKPDPALNNDVPPTDVTDWRVCGQPSGEPS
jgi:hypothetical protein